MNKWKQSFYLLTIFKKLLSLQLDFLINPETQITLEDIQNLSLDTFMVEEID